MIKNRWNGVFLSFVLVLVFSGCAKLAHLQQLMTLKAYSQNKDRQAEYVREQDEKFERLLKVFRAGTLGQYQDKQGFLKEFGDPVFTREVIKEGQSYHLWLYRYTAQFSGSEKLYLYFDEKGILRDWEHVPARKQEDEG